MFKYSGIRRFFSTVSIKLHAEKKAVEITLSNPKKRNPLSTETMNELYEKLIEVEKYSATEQARVNLLLLRL
jgi:enoyl-CoA hydratase/carnithine racemase